MAAIAASLRSGVLRKVICGDVVALVESRKEQKTHSKCTGDKEGSVRCKVEEHGGATSRMLDVGCKRLWTIIMRFL
jgi:hypothetical protein